MVREHFKVSPGDSSALFGLLDENDIGPICSAGLLRGMNEAAFVAAADAVTAQSGHAVSHAFPLPGLWLCHWGNACDSVSDAPVNALDWFLSMAPCPLAMKATVQTTHVTSLFTR